MTHCTQPPPLEVETLHQDKISSYEQEDFTGSERGTVVDGGVGLARSSLCMIKIATNVSAHLFRIGYHLPMLSGWLTVTLYSF